MSDSNRDDGLSDEQLHEVHRVSEQFEKRLRENDNPTIEDHLEMAAATVRNALFADLLEIEIEFRIAAEPHPFLLLINQPGEISMDSS